LYLLKEVIMLVSVSTRENHETYKSTPPPNLLIFRMDPDDPFYENDDYCYDFMPYGEYRTSLVPLGHRPSEESLASQGVLSFQALFQRTIVRPPASVTKLAACIFQTDVVNPHRDLHGMVWPISFVDKHEMHVIKRQEVATNDAVQAIRGCIAGHFQVSTDQLDVEYSS